MLRIALGAVSVWACVAAAGPALQQQVLPNGLTVLVVEDHSQPLVTVEVAARNGSFTEAPEYNGLSHLYEHMFFKGNQVIPDQARWLAKARSLGISWNGTTNTERVNYFFTTTSDKFVDSLTFLRDAIVTPLFDPKELEKERVVVTGEIDRNESNPFYYLWHESEKRIWWKYPSRKDPLGSRQTVLKATVDQMKTIQARYYVPNNSLLVVTGDVKPAEVFKLAESLFATWQRGADPFVKFPIVQHPPLPQTSVVLVQQQVGTVTGSLVWHGPSVKKDELVHTYAADLLALMAAEPSSKFQQALVDSGACVNVGFSWSTQVNVGPITAQFQATPANVDRCITALLAELPKLKAADAFSDEELANAGHTGEVNSLREREKPSELAHSLTFWWTSAGLDYYQGYVDNLKKVTRPHMADFLDQYVLGKPYVLSVMASPEVVKSGLDLKHFEKLIGAKPWREPKNSPPAKSEALR